MNARSDPSLQELAATIGDRHLTIPKPLTEGQLALVVDTMRTLNKAVQRFDEMAGALGEAKVPCDLKPFCHVRDYLLMNPGFNRLGELVMEHIDAGGKL